MGEDVLLSTFIVQIYL